MTGLIHATLMIGDGIVFIFFSRRCAVISMTMRDIRYRRFWRLSLPIRQGVKVTLDVVMVLIT